MVRKGRKKGTRRFCCPVANGVQKVYLAGSFNNWRPVRMRRSKGGAYAITIPLDPGVYEYKFVVDEQWLSDPDNSNWALNAFGTMNSVLTVES